MKFSIVTITFLLSILFLTHIMQHTIDITKLIIRNNNANSDNVVAAYFAGWNVYGENAYQVEDIYPIANKLTHIIYAFAKPNTETNTCDLQDSLADIGANLENRTKLSGNFAKLLKLKQKFPHIKILLSIGGGADSKDISKIIQNGYIKKFAESCISLLDQYEFNFINSKTGTKDKIIFKYPKLFDGLDLNWEWTKNIVPEQEAKAYGEMIWLFRKSLDKREKTNKSKQLLTATVQPNNKIFNALRIKVLVPYVDWFNIMTYNFSVTKGQSIGFNSPIYNSLSVYSINNVINYLINSNIPTKKIVLGIPLYGQVFDQTTGKIGSSFKKTKISRPLSYNKINDLYLHDKECEYTWNSSSAVPSLYCPKYKIFISYDNERSIKEKIQYIKENRLRGLFLWKLGNDDENNSLINSIFRAI